MNTQKNRPLIFGAIVAGLVAVLAFAAYQSKSGDGNGNGNAANRAVKIAGNVPLSGDLGVYGTWFRDGSTMANEELQKANPTGPQLSFDWQDNTFDQKTTVNVMQRQYLNSPDIYVSALKPQTMAITSQVAAKGTPHFEWILDINPNTGNPKGNNLRTWVSFKQEAHVFLDYARSRNAKRVAIVYLQLPAAEEEYNKVVIPGLKKQGATDFFVEAFNTDQSDFKNLAVKIKNFNPDLVIMNGFIPQMVGIVRSLRPLGVIKDGNTLGSIDMLDASTALSPAESEGIVVAAPTFITRPDDPQTKAWSQRFQARFSKAPAYHNAYAYDMTQIIYDAAKRLELPATSPEWIQALRATDIKGITGQLRFDENGSLITTMEPSVFRGGKIVPLK